MKKIVVCLMFLILPSLSFAGDEQKREDIENLLALMNVDAMVENMYSQMDKMMMGMAKQAGIQPSEKVIFERFMLKMTAAMKEEVSWAKMKDPLIDVYVKHYSDKEIADMVAFYNSESGRSMIQKMPAVMNDSMLVSQGLMQEFMPTIQELTAEFRQDLKEARSANQ